MSRPPTAVHRPLTARALLLLGAWIVLAQTLALQLSVPAPARLVTLCTAHGPVSLPLAANDTVPGADHACCFDCVLGTSTPPPLALAPVPPAPSFASPAPRVAFAAPLPAGYARPPARAPPIPV